MALLAEIKVPLLAVNDTTLTVAELACAAGTKVKTGDVIMVFETSKTTYDVEAVAEGFIQYCCEAGQDYEVDEVVARIYSEAAEALLTPAPVSSPATAGKPDRLPAPQANWAGETLFSLEAGRLMEKHGLDPAVFRGRDLVSAGDILQLLQVAAPAKTGTPANAVTTPAAGRRAAPVLAVDEARATVEKLTSAKKREIEYLGEIQATGLTSTVHTFVDTEGIFTHLNRSLRYLKDSLLPIILYESSRLLTGYPLLNAYYTGDAIATYKQVEPGFAIDIDKGLKVVKVAGAGEKILHEIELSILNLSGSYLDDNLKLEDLTGITFTITDLSAEAVAFFKPLINKMNSAILGVSAIDRKLERCTLSLTFDHRVTEGRLAARFLKELKERLESYRSEEGLARKDVFCFKCLKTLGEDLGDTGFMHCITPGGKEGYICQACLKGF
jgi:pyruvate/2-oxoglutarate dehydrogenase complex dihydrolipoamide acyltransferase (E2) component